MADINVLYIVVDSLRAGDTSLHGYRRETTPFLEEFAQQATVYTEARAPDRWSLPSHTSMFTGYHVAEHGMRKKTDQLEPGHTVFERLADSGYATGVFSANPYLTAMNTGLSRGFDTVVGTSSEPLFPDAINPQKYKSRLTAFLSDAIRHDKPMRSIANGVISKLAWDYPWLLPESIQDRVSSGVQSGLKYTDAFVSWLDDTEGSWGACINFMDTHHPYLPNKEHNQWDDGSIKNIRSSIRQYPVDFYAGREKLWKAEAIRNLYHGTIRQVDQYVHRIVQELKSRDILEQTLLIVTSDHGEGFGEYCPVHEIPVVGHNVGATEANLHVPLVVHWPNADDGRTITKPVSTTNLPHVVSAAREGIKDDPLVSSEPVVACSSGVTSSLGSTGSPCDDEQLLKDIPILYENTSKGIEKTVFDNSPSSRLIDRPEWEPTDRRFQDTVPLRDLSLKETQDESMTAEVEQRLEDLGYR